MQKSQILSLLFCCLAVLFNPLQHPAKAAQSGFSQTQLTQMSAFLSNFTELAFMNFDRKKGGDEDTLHLGNTSSQAALIGFGIMHNCLKNKSRIKPCPLKDCEHGQLIIEAKDVAESVKQFFDLDLKHASVDQTDPPYFFDGKCYHFSLAPDWEGIESLYRAEVKEARQEGNLIRMSGEIYDAIETKARPYTFVAYAKSRTWQGKESWAILSLRCTSRWFLKAAWDFVVGFKFPNGEDIDRDELGGNFAENELAFCDVNGDGQPELLIRFQSGSIASHVEFVSGFDEKKGRLNVELIATPGVEYFKNGCAKEKAAHNQGLAGAFWPYSFSVYNPKTGKYEQKGSVDAWSREAYPTNPFDNDKPFPKAMDVTGDGFVYFIHDAGFQGAKGDQPVDTPVYQAWVGHYLGGAEPVKVEWVPATASGIRVLETK